jgi:adenosylmethionine-8-amino-7-oxononanoate aminotransferase
MRQRSAHTFAPDCGILRNVIPPSARSAARASTTASRFAVREAAGAAQATARVVNALRQEGVLIGSTGRNRDVLKIRPPLPFTRDNADLLLHALDKVLA